VTNLAVADLLRRYLTTTLPFMPICSNFAEAAKQEARPLRINFPKCQASSDKGDGTRSLPIDVTDFSTQDVENSSLAPTYL
jgi:hypothetical protein